MSKNKSRKPNWIRLRDKRRLERPWSSFDFGNDGKSVEENFKEIVEYESPIFKLFRERLKNCSIDTECSPDRVYLAPKEWTD